MLVFFALDGTFKNKFNLVYLGFLTTILLSVFVGIDGANSFVYFLRFLEFGILWFLISSGFLDFKKLSFTFVAALTLISLIGIGQYFLQHSVGLQIIGEPVLTQDIKGIAKFAFGDQFFIRAYGTFAHPNIFAGYLLLGIFLSLNFLRQKLRKLQKILLAYVFVILFLALILTFSRSGLLALVAGLVVYFYPKFDKKYLWRILVGLMCLGLVSLLFEFPQLIFQRIFDSQGISERFLFYDISWKMFLDHPFGVGIGNFTSLMQNYSVTELQPWNYQPVHNLFFLIVNEVGLLGLGLFMMLIWEIFKNSKDSKNRSLLSVLLVLAFFDHYFLSIYQGQALLILYLATLDYSRSKSPELT